MESVLTTLVTDDPVTEHGIVAALRSARGVKLVPLESAHRAEIILVAAFTVTDALLARLQPIATAALNPGQRVVLLADHVTEVQLKGLEAMGPVTLLARTPTTPARLLHALAERSWSPPERQPVRAAAADEHLPGGGLQPRELDVVRLLSQGLSTEEVARRLNFSERTIKAIIHNMLLRLGLRNRPHAVAYAVRARLL
ncbi:LuxR C-terminal-related transcriptional regulator [Streptomyces sp. NPDC035033]|uniref:helix-turn-helix transcriptional regulator n=1 Tax=Streptomyces sp. NPDC035033 TaxID=3155368 RepID=UPI0033FCD778